MKQVRPTSLHAHLPQLRPSDLRPDPIQIGPKDDAAEFLRDLEAALLEAEREQQEAARRPVRRAPSEDEHRERESDEQPDALPGGKVTRRPHVRRWNPREPLPAVGVMRPGVLRPTAKEFLVNHKP